MQNPSRAQIKSKNRYTTKYERYVDSLITFQHAGPKKINISSKWRKKKKVCMIHSPPHFAGSNPKASSARFWHKDSAMSMNLIKYELTNIRHSPHPTKDLY